MRHLPFLLLLLGSATMANAACSPSSVQAEEPTWTQRSRPLEDGLVLTADDYPADPADPADGSPEEPTEESDEGTDAESARSADAPPAPIVVCLHMAGSSRGEYRAIAPELTRRGLRVLAVDLRSGNRRFGVVNETAQAWSKRTGRSKASYAEAYPDVEEAVAWARELAPDAPIVLVGSSYSASLALVYAARHPDVLDLVVSLSPGEYMRDWTSIAAEAAKIRVPTYITCGNGTRERGQAEPIADAIPAEHRSAWFPPDDVAADHGSRTLMVADREARAEQWRRLDLALAKLH